MEQGKAAYSSRRVSKVIAMNFLAHAYLAAPDEALIAGGVIGDWIKGPLDRQPLPAGLLRGVALHRAIDAFADRNEAFLRSRARISAARRRWSGVFIDMYYDHLLAAGWDDWNDRPLADFTAQTYLALDRQAAQLAPEVNRVMALMTSEDWLGSYASIDGLAAVLGRMGRRVRQPNPLAEGVDELIAQRAEFAADFAEFLPAAQAFVADWINRAPPSAGSA